ncbi:UNVERIFIED_CONTAM: hypothetical protein K2H54_022431 [Gekko kuhli]
MIHDSLFHLIEWKQKHKKNTGGNGEEEHHGALQEISGGAEPEPACGGWQGFQGVKSLVKWDTRMMIDYQDITQKLQVLRIHLQFAPV